MTVRELIIELMDGDLNREVHLCIPQDVTESDSKTGITSRTTGVIFNIDNVEHHSGICYLNFIDWRASKNESTVRASTTKNDLGVDCISRAKAIEEADQLCLETGYDNEKVVEMLRDLPPVILQDKDAISRQAVRMAIFDECVGDKLDIDFAKVLLLQRAIKALPPIYAESEDK